MEESFTNFGNKEYLERDRELEIWEHSCIEVVDTVLQERGWGIMIDDQLCHSLASLASPACSIVRG